MAEKNVNRVDLLNRKFLIVNYSETIKKSDIKDEAKKNDCEYIMIDNEILEIK